MNKFNSNPLTSLDIINLMSFMIAIMNLNENLNQGDKQELLEGLSNQTSELFKEGSPIN